MHYTLHMTQSTYFTSFNTTALRHGYYRYICNTGNNYICCLGILHVRDVGVCIFPKLLPKTTLPLISN